MHSVQCSNKLLYQVSKDGLNWTTLVDHQDDSRLTEPGSTATWKISLADGDSEECKTGWRHVRLQQNGKNSSGQTHYLSLSGISDTQHPFSLLLG